METLLSIPEIKSRATLEAYLAVYGHTATPTTTNTPGTALGLNHMVPLKHLSNYAEGSFRYQLSKISLPTPITGKKMLVVDLGCGSITPLIDFMDHYKKLLYLGVEYSEEFYRDVKSRYRHKNDHQQSIFIQGDATSLDRLSSMSKYHNQASVVIMRQGNFSDKPFIFSRMLIDTATRLLRDGGKLILTFYHDHELQIAQALLQGMDTKVHVKEQDFKEKLFGVEFTGVNPDTGNRSGRPVEIEVPSRINFDHFALEITYNEATFNQTASRLQRLQIAQTVFKPGDIVRPENVDKFVKTIAAMFNAPESIPNNPIEDHPDESDTMKAARHRRELELKRQVGMQHTKTIEKHPGLAKRI